MAALTIHFRRTFLVTLGLALVMSALACTPREPVLSGGNPGVSVLGETTLLSALPVNNSGGAAVESVTVTAITLNGATLTSPSKLPFDLGTIQADGSAVLDAGFSAEEPFARFLAEPFCIHSAD